MANNEGRPFFYSHPKAEYLFITANFFRLTTLMIVAVATIGTTSLIEANQAALTAMALTSAFLWQCCQIWASYAQNDANEWCSIKNRTGLKTGFLHERKDNE